MGDREFIANYEKAVAHLNCVHTDEHGVCKITSDDETNEYCPLSPCPYYEEKTQYAD